MENFQAAVEIYDGLVVQKLTSSHLQGVIA
jgi:hypothetical protein